MKQILAVQTEMIEQAKQAEIPIIFLEYKHYGKTNKILRKAAKGHDDVKYFLKTSDGMFAEWNEYRSELISYLEEKDIGTLIITGANGGACVASSIRGSIIESYDVIAFSKGIADFNYRDFIYPYDDIYQFRHNYKDCTFTELDELSEYTLVLANSKNNSISSEDQIDDSSRGFISKKLTDVLNKIKNLFSSETSRE